MRKAFLSALAAVLALLPASAQVQDPNFFIYLCFGQSNMEAGARLHVGLAETEIDEEIGILHLRGGRKQGEDGRQGRKESFPHKKGDWSETKVAIKRTAPITQNAHIVSNSVQTGRDIRTNPYL